MLVKTKWIELITNTSGKLSGSGLIGVLTGFVALGCFISGVVLIYKGNKDGLEVLTTSAYLVTIGGTILGIRRFTITKNEKDIRNTSGNTTTVGDVNI